ncbi:TRIM2_3 [Mytilus coruscus]|uniref:TRIM2_3 n=1 Tax=Mytilus coruscus TaxID=42192 RepID=A0A6J8CZQ0_MYTCO|nr:TRIM2_3 [Mytilus coruscus]
MKSEIQNTKKYASNLQAFLSMRGIQAKTTEYEKHLQISIENINHEKVYIESAIDTQLQDILTVERFGSIKVKKSPSTKITLKRRKDRQAQIQVIAPKAIKVEFKRKLDTTCQYPSGCCVTKTGEFLLTNYEGHNGRVIAINAEDKVEYTIPFLARYSTFDIVCLDDSTVAVSTDYSITTIPNTASPWYSYVSTQADNIFCTNPDKHTVTCCLYSGALVWKFKDESVLDRPQGITVDNKGNVFVAGMDSCNVVVISPDGKQCNQILTREDGLDRPTAIFFDKERKKLLVTNQKQFAYIYDVCHF